MNAVQTYAVPRPVGRALIDLPWTSRAPYQVWVSAHTLLDLPGPYVKQRLACPSAGCLPGYTHEALLSGSPPPPVLPLHGLTRAQLEASVREVVAGQTWPSVIATRCESLHLCVLTFMTPGFPKQPYRVPYLIFGQQVNGCWMGWHQRNLDPLPYTDAGNGPMELAGCRHWLG